MFIFFLRIPSGIKTLVDNLHMFVIETEDFFFYVLFQHMSELRSYCTVAFATPKRLYLEFCSMNFDNFFFKILLPVYPTYRKTIKVFGFAGYEVFKQEWLK
jgi:hypothetical protein